MARKKKTDDAPDGSGLIQMMTVSLFIILLAFFILLNAIAIVDEKKKLMALGSLLRSFSIMAGGDSLVAKLSLDLGSPTFQTETSQVDFSPLFQDESDFSLNIRVTENKRGSVVRLPADLIFEPGGSNLHPTAGRWLEPLAQVMRTNDYPVDIVGHMDNGQAVAAQAPSTREVSVARSLRLFEYFVANGKVRPERISAFGWGAHRPLTSNTTPETRAMNRRMEVVFIHDKQPDKPSGVFIFKRFFFKVFD